MKLSDIPQMTYAEADEYIDSNLTSDGPYRHVYPRPMASILEVNLDEFSTMWEINAASWPSPRLGFNLDSLMRESDELSHSVDRVLETV